jgi:hypothetical protein
MITLQGGGCCCPHHLDSDIELFDKLRLESASDPQVATVCAKLITGEAGEGWSLQDELLLFRGKIFLPDASSLWP